MNEKSILGNINLRYFLRNRFRRLALNQFLILEESVEDELYSFYFEKRFISFSSFYISVFTMSTSINQVFGCHICYNTFADAPRQRRHLLAQHNLSVPSTKRGNRRYGNEKYSYVKCLGKRESNLVTGHSACTSCLEHFSVLLDLGNHLQTHVIPQTTTRKAYPVRYILICLLLNISLTRDFFIRHLLLMSAILALVAKPRVA
jgi:hypothetical protein